MFGKEIVGLLDLLETVEFAAAVAASTAHVVIGALAKLHVSKVLDQELVRESIFVDDLQRTVLHLQDGAASFGLGIDALQDLLTTLFLRLLRACDGPVEVTRALCCLADGNLQFDVVTVLVLQVGSMLVFVDLESLLCCEDDFIDLLMDIWNG